jgi:hypothetical protein
MSLRTLPSVALAAVLLAAPALAQDGPLRPAADQKWCSEESEYGHYRTCVVYEGTLPAGGSISVDGRPNGGIHVQGWDRNEVRLRAKVVTRADDEAEARQMASEVRIETSPTIRAQGPARTGGRDRSWSVSYRLDVPRRSALSLESTNGGIHLSDVEGDITFNTTNGGLHLKDIGGNVKGRTTNGGVHLQLEGSEWRGEGLDLVTTNGGVHVQVPRGYNARLKVGTTNGRVHGDLAGDRSIDEDESDEDDDDPGVRVRHDRRRRNMDVVLGSGGKMLSIRTTNGGVHVNQD